MSHGTYIHFDDSRWPLLIVQYAGTPTNEQFAESLARRSSYLDRGPHVTVLDLSGAPNPGPPEQRHMQVDWLKRNEARLRDQSLGVAFVTDSAVMKLLLSIIQHLKPMPTPYVTFKHLSEAVTWAAECLERAGRTTEARHAREHVGPLAGRRSA
ncbi:hypothetical protein JRI60_47825 [Archangium violaceum]|uniref:hypothetical protein n=1 Tax=Archangium violaceum TaxID=83451 RepID=UPI00195245DB|nr:hypothetical protein [Archangium violaceum]QRN96625.1 hypothetical protein JRI60_47825 [Archangium violaceum]